MVGEEVGKRGAGKRGERGEERVLGFKADG